MKRRYEYVKSPVDVENIGIKFDYFSFASYIPHDYKEHTYPAFLELVEPEDAHGHDHYVWNNKLTKDEFINERRYELRNECLKTEREINRLMRCLSDLQDEDDNLANLFD